MRYQDLINQLGSFPLNLDALASMRKVLIRSIEEVTKRPLIIYAARLNVGSEALGRNIINLEDVVGFTDLVTNIPGPNLDVLIESPGGMVEAAQRIVNILRNKFTNIRFFVVGSAYSAATMLALSGNSIIMHDSACLGPIDPQIGGAIPARSILNGFENVKRILSEEGSKSLPAYIPLLNKIDIPLLELCKDAEERGKLLVIEWLKNYMLKDYADADRKAQEIAQYFSNYDHHKSHTTPIFLKDAKEKGVVATPLLDEPGQLNTLVWDLYLHIKFVFESTNFAKLFENSQGVSWGNQLPILRIPMPMPQTHPEKQ